MSKIAVIYWSAGGNTEAMAKAIAKGIASENVGAEVFSVSEIDVYKRQVLAAQYERLGGVSAGGEVFLRYVEVADDILYDVFEIFFQQAALLEVIDEFREDESAVRLRGQGALKVEGDLFMQQPSSDEGDVFVCRCV